jgi:hypothetical protein
MERSIGVCIPTVGLDLFTEVIVTYIVRVRDKELAILCLSGLIGTPAAIVYLRSKRTLLCSLSEIPHQFIFSINQTRNYISFLRMLFVGLLKGYTMLKPSVTKRHPWDK